MHIIIEKRAKKPAERCFCILVVTLAGQFEFLKFNVDVAVFGLNLIPQVFR